MMRWLTWLLLAIALALPSVSTAADDDAFLLPFLQAEPSSTARITMGLAAKGSFPSILQIQHIGQVQPPPGGSAALLCAASLVAPKWALTAAHCLYPFADPATGEYRRLHPREIVLRGDTPALGQGGLTLSVVDIREHEQYRPPTKNGSLSPYDIALLELSEPVTLPVVTLATAEVANEALQPQKKAVVVGWGTTKFDPTIPTFSPVLLQADIDVIDMQTCQRANALDVGHDRFCAGVMDISHCAADGTCPDACQGDSGGPLFVETSSGRMQVGVVSWGRQCGRAGYPGVYTSVPFHEDWLRKRLPPREAKFATPPPPAFAATDQAVAPLLRPPVPAYPGFGPALTVSLTSGSALRVGETAVMTMVSNVSGRLVVVHESADGTGYVLLPNQQLRQAGRKREAVAINRPRLVPDPHLDDYDITIVGPHGKKRFIVIVLPDTPAIEQTVAAAMRPGRTIPNVAQWVSRLASGLKPGYVAVGRVEYEVVGP